jgi:hypothetical protein
MDHEVSILTRHRHQTLSLPPLPHVCVQIGFLLIAAYVLMSGIGDGLASWTSWGVAPALVGMAGATGPGGSRWTDRRSRARRSARRPRLIHERPRVIREPESGWWDAHPEPSPTAMTVAVVSESETWLGAEAVVSRLAEFAVNDELIVVYSADRWSSPGHHAVVAGLSDHLPRHHVVAFHITPLGAGLGRGDALLLDQLLENGSLPVVVTPASAVYDVTAELSSCLRADRVLRVLRTDRGADVHQVWRREAAATAG